MPSEIKRALLGRLAIHAGLVTQQQVLECLNEQQEQFRAKKKVPRLGELLYKKGYLSKEQVRALLLYRKSVTAPPEPPEGNISSIGDYEILGKLGTDATGTSYKARNKKTDVIVTLNVMSHSVMGSGNFRERFVEETRRGASLKHPNIRRLITVGCKEGRYFYTSEYIEGTSLKRILKKRTKLSVEEAARITAKLASALNHGHEKGIIHGDIRPGNVLITTSGDVKLTDFGVLKDTLRNLMRLLGTADTVGFYVAPEQAVGDRVIDERADVYSLGALYYHMLVGRPPFEGGSPLQSLVRLCEENFTSPHEADASIPEAVSQIVSRMIQAEPSQRYRTMADLEQDLAGAVGVAAEAAPAARQPVEESPPVESAVEYVPDSWGEPSPSPVEPVGVAARSVTAKKPPEAAKGRRGLRRAQEKHTGKSSGMAWAVAAVAASIVVVLVVVWYAFFYLEESEKKTPAPPAPDAVEGAGEGEPVEGAGADEPVEHAGTDEPVEGAGADEPLKTEGKEPEPGKVKGIQEPKPAQVEEVEPQVARKEEEAEPKPEPKKKPATKEDAAFGRGGSLFAPVGWKAPKPSDEEDEEEGEEEEDEEDKEHE